MMVCCPASAAEATDAWFRALVLGECLQLDSPDAARGGKTRRGTRCRRVLLGGCQAHDVASSLSLHLHTALAAVISALAQPQILAAVRGDGGELR